MLCQSLLPHQYVFPLTVQTRDSPKPAFFLLDQYETNPDLMMISYLLINRLLQIGVLMVVFCLECSQAASSSHVAYAVIASTVIYSMETLGVGAGDRLIL